MGDTYPQRLAAGASVPPALSTPPAAPPPPAGRPSHELAPGWRQDPFGLMVLELGELAERMADAFHFNECGARWHQVSHDEGVRFPDLPACEFGTCVQAWRVVSDYRRLTLLDAHCDGHIGHVAPDGTWREECNVCARCKLHTGSMNGLIAHHDREHPDNGWKLIEHPGRSQ